MLKQQHQVFVSLLGVVDAVMVTGACYAAWALRRLSIETFFARQWENYLVKEPLVVLILPLALLSMRAFGLYRPRRDRSVWGEQLQIIKASFATVVLAIVLLWALGNRGIIVGDPNYGPARFLGFELGPGQIQFGFLLVLLPTLVGGHRLAFRILLRMLRRRGHNLRHIAIIGTGRLGQIAHRTLTRNPWTGLSVAYFISHHDVPLKARCSGVPVRGGLLDLEPILQANRVDAVYLALPNARAAQIPGLLQRLEKFPVDVRIIPDVQARYIPQSMAVGEIDGMPILSYRANPTAGLGGAAKAFIDFGGAVAALAIFAIPMLLIALLVRFSGPGPVIFRQRRVSLGGEEFQIFKFRTMRHVEDERNPMATAPAAWTERDDPRITPVGRFLRRSSLDELPQLFNVLRGEMSLVGPRPERPELIDRFKEDWRGYMIRQHVKAGMTGWAQVHGLRGQTSLRKRLQYDLFYIRNWSVGLDLRILWLTLFRGFIHRNAH